MTIFCSPFFVLFIPLVPVQILSPGWDFVSLSSLIHMTWLSCYLYVGNNYSYTSYCHLINLLTLVIIIPVLTICFYFLLGSKLGLVCGIIVVAMKFQVFSRIFLGGWYILSKLDAQVVLGDCYNAVTLTTVQVDAKVLKEIKKILQICKILKMFTRLSEANIKVMA